LWEAFLLQMNDFDRFLEMRLREMLDPVVARRPPMRRGQLGGAVEPARVELFTEAIPAVEPVGVTPAAPAPPL